MEIIKKIRNLIKRGLVTLNRTSQEGQASYLGKTSNYESIKPYGFDSIPKESDKPLVILFNLNGNESNKVGFEYNNKQLFKTEKLNPGEVVVYNPFNQSSYIIFKNTGETKTVGTKIAIGNSTTELLKQISDDLQLQGDHFHSSIMGATGTPNNRTQILAIKTKVDSIKGTIS